MSNSVVDVFSKQAMFQVRGPIPSNRGTCKGGQSHGIFFLSLILMLEIYVQFWCQPFLEAGEVSGPGTNSIESRGHVRVANHMGFYFYR